MGDQYVGRHRRAVAAAHGTPPQSARHALHPAIHASATVVLAGACVAGYLVADGAQVPLQDRIGEAAAGLIPAVFQRSEPSGFAGRVAAQDRRDPEVQALAAHEALANASAKRALDAQQASAAAAAAAEAQQLEAARQLEAERAAREAQRQSILANARSDPKSVARVMVAEAGWNDSQFQCLVKLWTKESNWRYTATNRSSGAYGIPQSLPGSKMASAGPDWRTNPVTQIKWGLGYIKSRYGSPCNAWGHSVRYNWY